MGGGMEASRGSSLTGAGGAVAEAGGWEEAEKAAKALEVLDGCS